MKPNQKLKNWRVNVKQLTHKQLQDEINALIQEKGLELKPIWVGDISDAERAKSTFKFKKVMHAISILYDDIEYDQWGMLTEAVSMQSSDTKEASHQAPFDWLVKLESTSIKLENSLIRQAELERNVLLKFRPDGHLFRFIKKSHTFNIRLKPLTLKIIGRELTSHYGKHFAGTFAVEHAGFSDNEAKDLLGISDVRTARIYAKRNTKRLATQFVKSSRNLLENLED